jgi:hypothetical protein
MINSAAQTGAAVEIFFSILFLMLTLLLFICLFARYYLFIDFIKNLPSPNMLTSFVS